MKEKNKVRIPRISYSHIVSKQRMLLPNGDIKVVDLADARTGEIWAVIENSCSCRQTCEDIKALTNGCFLNTELKDLIPKVGFPRYSFYHGSIEDHELYTFANSAPGVIKYAVAPWSGDCIEGYPKVTPLIDVKSYNTPEFRASCEADMNYMNYASRKHVNFRKEFIDIFESELIKQGFTRRQAVFYRLTVGKMVQIISYVKYSGGEYSLQFRNAPLCAGFEYLLFMDDKRLDDYMRKRFYGFFDKRFDEFVLCWTIAKDNTEALKDALEACKLIILPELDKISDYRSYYEESKHRHKISCLKNKYDPNYSSFGLESITSPAFYNVSMQLGDFEMPQAALENMFKSYEIDPNTDPSSWIDDVRKLYELIEAHKRGDDDYIKNSIEADEAHSLESFKNNIIGKRKLKADGKINFYEVKKDNYEY